MDEFRRIFSDDLVRRVAEDPLRSRGGIQDFPISAEEAYRITAIFNEGPETPFALFNLTLGAFPADEVADLMPQGIRHFEEVGVRLPFLPREQHDDSRRLAPAPDRKCEQAVQVQPGSHGCEFPAL